MIDYPALRAALDALPAGTDDKAAAEALTAATVTAARPIPAAEIKRLWGRWGVLGMAWVKAGDATLPDQARAFCRATYDNLLHDLFTDLDPAEPEAAKDIAMYLDALVGAGVLTEEQRAATLALGTQQVPARRAWGFDGAISHTDIEIARKLA